MAEGPRGAIAPRGSVSRGGGRRTSLEKSQVPFFAGWGDHSCSIEGSAFRGLGAPASPSPQPSPHTVVQEGRKGSVLLGGDYQRTGVDEDVHAGGRDAVVGPVIEVVHYNTPDSVLPPFVPTPLPLPFPTLRRLSTGLEDTSSGGEASDSSSLAHMMVRKEMSQRSFKKLMMTPSHLALACPIDHSKGPRSAPSAPTILMFSSPSTQIERPKPMVRSLTFSEALRNSFESPSSPQSSIGPLPQMPARPRYGRRLRSSHESLPHSVVRSGKGLNPRMLNRSTASSNNSLNPPSMSRTTSSHSTIRHDRPQYRKSHISFAASRNMDEGEIALEAPPPSGAVALNKDARRSSFPWTSLARAAEEARRFTYPVESSRSINEAEPRPSVLHRMRSMLSRVMKPPSPIPLSARDALPRRSSVERSRKRRSLSGDSLDVRKTCFSRVSSLFARRGARLSTTPLSSGKAKGIFSCPACSAKPNKQGAARLDRSRSSTSYHGGDGKHYILPQVPWKRETWLPSEMTRIHTPPLDHENKLTGRHDDRISRGFFFDHRKPPGFEDGDDARNEAALRKNTSAPALLPMQVPEVVTSNMPTAPLTPMMSRGSFSPWARYSRGKLGASMSQDDTPSPGARRASIYPEKGSIRGDLSGGQQTDYFRQRIDRELETPGAGSATGEENDDSEVEMVMDLPDHLPNSPICPRNAKYYGLRDTRTEDGKRRVCPVHGGVGKRIGNSGADAARGGKRRGGMGGGLSMGMTV